MAPSTAIPPPLPPSVEEAYRRKCLQLKQRTGEVEEANDAARARLVRLKRQVEKMRIERAFLLEQLAKRTSTNVEDSEGSPSPPPTPTAKPLRTKRGHRKPSLIAANLEAASSAAAAAGGAGDATPGSTFASQNPRTLSPSSDAFSHNRDADAQKKGGGGKSEAEDDDDDAAAAAKPSSRANGVGGKPPKKPSTAFELYCGDARPKLAEAGKEDGSDDAAAVEEELERGWKALPEDERDEYQARHDKALAEYEKAKEAYDKKAKAAKNKKAAAEAEAAAAAADAKASEPPAESQAEDTPARDEDVEMTNYDTEQDTPGVDKADD